MKKLFTFVVSGFLVAFMLTGCGNDNTATLTCNFNGIVTSNGTGNRLSVNTVYDITYDGDDVKEIRVVRDYVNEQDANSANDVDGVGTGTDGTASDDDAIVNDGEADSDDIIDGVVGDAIDAITGAVANTILDIAGIKQDYVNRVTNYGDMLGFDSTVEVDNDHEYKIVYVIDMDQISDVDLSRFDYSRSLSTLRSKLEGKGLTCKQLDFFFLFYYIFIKKILCEMLNSWCYLTWKQDKNYYQNLLF